MTPSWTKMHRPIQHSFYVPSPVLCDNPSSAPACCEPGPGSSIGWTNYVATTYMQLPFRILLAVLCLGVLINAPTIRAAANLSTWVYPGSSGRLLSRPDFQGNRIPDSSGVGYRSGIVPLPSANTVPVRTNVSPVIGDNTANIQSAINYVSGLPIDPNGFRGAVLLSAGVYPCSNTIKITASGVVLRGVGSFTNGSGTVLQATASNQYSLVQITGSGSASTVSGTTHNITNNYVPVGARSFTVDSISGLALGDHVFVRRVATSNWIHDLGMDLLTNPWTPDGYNIDMDRTITRIEGNRIFVDSPITCAIDRQYTNGTIRKFTWSGRITNSGIEHIYAKSDFFGNNTNENHGWIFVQFNNIENGWARDLVSQYFGYACVALYGGTKCVTVSDCQCLDPVSIITGGRRYAFVMDDNRLCLVRNCYTRQDRHQYVTQSLTTGPNVFVDSLSDSAHAEAGPHHRWATAVMWDNITVNGHNLDAQNTCESGTGHGWEGANCTIWNSKANSLVVANPPGAHNWLIGSIGNVSDGSSCHGIPPWSGAYDSSGPNNAGGTNVFPNSLYFAQLQDRLAAPNLQAREYWLGEIDGFSGVFGDLVPVDAAWRSAIQSVASGQPLDAFDIVTNNHWVPFTFNFVISPTEHIIGASLSLCMRATNSASGDVLYLDSLTNAFNFSSLGWLPISTSQLATNATTRVLDVGNQLNLLTNGQLNVAIQGDIGIDWALLELQVAPTVNLGTLAISPTADATVRGGASANLNFGTATTLTTKNDSAADNNRQSYLRWDLTTITQKVFQARVRLTPASVGTNGIEQGVSVATTNNWNESTITWNNQPGRGERFANWIPAANTPLSFDVTPQVLDALANDKQLSLQLFSVRNVGAAGNVDYASRESSDPATRPQLLLSLLGSPPTISDITDRNVPVNGSTGPIPFTIGDADSPAGNLVLSGRSSDQSIVPDANIVFGGSDSNRTVTVSPAPNQSGLAVITISVTDPSDLTVSDNFTLTVSSHPPSTIVWNGPGAGLNTWSTAGNWSTAEAPEALDNVKFYDPGANGVAVSNINNVVDFNFDGTIGSLQFANTNGNHTTLISPGSTLTISGSAGFTVGTETDNGSGQTVFSTFTGSSGELVLDNPAADLIVRQGSATSSSQRATLDFSGLGNFIADLSQILIGVIGPVNRATGTLFLARTNTIFTSGSPGICAADNNSNNGGQNFIYLGQTNAIFTDSITIARQKGTATLRFNPVFPNSSAFFRGSDGVSRVSTWNIADNSAQSTSSSSSIGTNDFSGGSIDALVDILIVGKSQKTTGANSSGVLTFTAGTIDVNTLQIGLQAQSGATSGGIGRVNVNGSARLYINNVLELGRTSGGAGTTNTVGTLSINGGSVFANSLAAGAGSGSNTVAINNGSLVVTNSVGTLSVPITSVMLTNSTLQFSVANGVTNVVATTVITGGSSNRIDITTLPISGPFPAQYQLLKYASPIAGAGYNFVLGSLPTGPFCNAYLSNNIINGSVDLVVINCGVADTFLIWNGDISADWDTETANWKNNLGPGLIYADGNDVLFNESATGTTTINLTDILTPSSVTISNNTSTYVFQGLGNLSGSTGLTKQGSGTFILANNGSNDFTGETIISAGTVILSNSASIANSAKIDIALGATLDVSPNPGTLFLSPGQTLQGDGTLNGSLVVNPGATLSPGNSIGALTITNTVTLVGVTFIELNKSFQTNDIVRSFSTINYGGTLQLTNLIGTLDTTDTFRLFVASNYSGAFTDIVPATTGTGFAWDTTQLAVNGTLRLAALPKPGINSATVSGNKLVLNGTNGISGGLYILLSSTNLATPLSNWLPLATNTFDFSGRFSYTNSIIIPQQFFVIQAF
jgi:autotransporter-associated beta strand protein